MKKKIKINKNLSVFSFFVLFATIIWFLNELNQEYDTEISLPVTYYNMPVNKANISNLPEKFVVFVTAYGYDIIKYQLKKTFIPTKIDVQSSLFIKLYDNDTNHYYILTREFIGQIEKQLNDKMTIKRVKPDTLYFHFTKFASKKVPVVINSSIIPKNQYILKGDIEISPDSIVISGPLAIIDTIESIETDYFELNSIYDNTIYEASIEELQHIKISPQIVNLHIDIEEYTEMRFDIPIEITNVPDSVYFHLFPNSVTVVSKVGFSNYDKIHGSDFKIIVDYYSIFKNEDSKLKTKLINSPEGIYEFYYTPEYVEYIIEKK